MSVKQTWIDYIHRLQNKICAAVEELDGIAKFIEDSWERAEGGGGKTRVISNGRVFEKGERLRKRFRCTEKKTGLVYLFSPVYEVKPVK